MAKPSGRDGMFNTNEVEQFNMVRDYVSKEQLKKS